VILISLLSFIQHEARRASGVASVKRTFVEGKGKGKKKRENQDNAQLRQDESVKSAGITGELFDPVSPRRADM